MDGSEKRCISDLAHNAERLAVNEKKQAADGIPVYLPIGGYWSSPFAGYDTDRYFLDYDVQLATQLKVRERFYGLTGVFVDPGVVTEAVALGASPVYPKDSAPWVKPLLERYDDVKKLGKPDLNSGILKNIFGRFALLREGGYSPSFYPGIGPFDAAALLRGADRLFVDLYENPAWVRGLMELCTDAMIDIFREEERLNGGSLPGGRIVIGDDYPGMIGPENFKKFVYPYLEKIYRSFDGSYGKWWHSDANEAADIVGCLVELGVDVFFGMSSNVDLSRIRKRFGNAICLCGNVSTMTMLRGTSGDVADECARLMKAVRAEQGAFILCPGGEIVTGTPVENIDALIFSACRYRA